MTTVKASPVITDSTSKESLSMSLFSEWLENTIMAHHEFVYKTMVVSTDALADEAINDATSASPRSSLACSRSSFCSSALECPSACREWRAVRVRLRQLDQVVGDVRASVGSQP